MRDRENAGQSIWFMTHLFELPMRDREAFVSGGMVKRPKARFRPGSGLDAYRNTNELATFEKAGGG